ncbi:lytic murein transglycosylase [Phaeovibrio sulfidiphilus]|uniref:Lytic murein transglycosylase n=1 Tax=Phaeovibrio sulfidiphilus TaxID=1220600 RepID=A0A8J6YXU5_9PROT|nr:lytic murein transglycosylase [Phaeovibrio sulfidiphilus]MBE1237662.1 lytic murein transglycosylase [Phaeovibrio sulfidiphilus]
MLRPGFLVPSILVASALLVFPACSQSPRANTGAPLGAEPNIAGSEQGFRTWLRAVKAEALQAGISPATVETVLARAEYLPSSVEKDTRQPEFSRTTGDYFRLIVPESRVVKALEKISEHQSLLNRLQREYGVPAGILVALWGLESNFGENIGSTPIIDTLATLAYDGRRGAFFKSQLFDALRILDGGHVQASNMIGSWAGAMGQTQFMPSTFLAYAVDGDGDGWLDPWNSVSDALASGANYLGALGWNRSLPWGREVVLPPSFDYSRTDLGGRATVAEWSALGVRLASGGAIPENPSTPAAILVPSGYRGPAFLVYENFDILLKWNRSINYALAAGYLSDRVSGVSTALHQPFPDTDRSLRLTEIMEIQELLNARGFDAGQPDGLIGARTRLAIRHYQASRGLVADGYPDESLLLALRVR